MHCTLVGWFSNIPLLEFVSSNIPLPSYFSLGCPKQAFIVKFLIALILMSKVNSLDAIMYMGTFKYICHYKIFFSFFTVVVCAAQVSQLGAAAQKYQAATQNASSNLSVPELQNNCNM